MIFTCRASWEGGHFPGSEDERLRLLQQARRTRRRVCGRRMASRALPIGSMANGDGQGVVVSAHDFDGVPGDLERAYAAMRATGAEVVKLAVMAARLTDCLPLLALRETRRSADGPAGDGRGRTRRRVCSPRASGRAWTYAGDARRARAGAGRAAPHGFGFDRVNAARRSTASSGGPSCTRCRRRCTTPRSRRRGIDAVYLPLAAADFDDFLRLRRCARCSGRECHRAVQARRVRSASDESTTTGDAWVRSTR